MIMAHIEKTMYIQKAMPYSEKAVAYIQKIMAHKGN